MPTTDIRIPAGDVALEGSWSVPAGARGAVVFAHGSGSSRFSPRNAKVAARLFTAGFATLLLDLLTSQEERLDAITAELRFDIELLARRLSRATEWLRSAPDGRGLPAGYFGASTGAAAALRAAADKPEWVQAIVSRGGRPDLARLFLPRVEAATLLIVGGRDAPVIEMNRSAYADLRGEKELVIVPGATHLFEEPGALEEVARLATAWFERRLVSGGGRRAASAR